MKIAEVREMSTEEIVERITVDSKRLNEMTLNHSISPLENPAQITHLRKDIARLKTELRQRELSK